jgi:hypothetical protein
MNMILLSVLFLGGAPSGNWLPLISPLLLLLLIIVGVDKLRITLKRRKLNEENRLIDDLGSDQKG